MSTTDITAHVHHEGCRCDVSAGIDVRFDCPRCHRDTAMLIAPDLQVNLLFCATCEFRIVLCGDLYARVVGD